MARVVEDRLEPLGVHACVTVELLLAPLAWVQWRLQNMVEQLECRTQRVLRRRLDVLIQVAHEIGQQLVKDGWQAVVVVEEKVVHCL